MHGNNLHDDVTNPCNNIINPRDIINNSLEIKLQSLNKGYLHLTNLSNHYLGHYLGHLGHYLGHFLEHCTILTTTSHITRIQRHIHKTVQRDRVRDHASPSSP